MTTAQRTLLMIALGTMLCLAPASAFAGTLVAQVDGPLVIGDQVFSGRQLEVAPVLGGRALAVRLDGRQVALAYPEAGRRGVRGIVLRADARGYRHLAGLRMAGARPSATVAIAAVTDGASTFGPGPGTEVSPSQEIVAAR